MIILYHQYNKVVEIMHDGQNIDFFPANIAKTLFKTAIEYPDDLMIWCNVDLKSNLNFSKLDHIFHHHKIMASYNLAANSFLSQSIGYVEDSPFIKINKVVSYPTWQMSSCVGGIKASSLMLFKNKIKESDSFDYFLNSLAKLAMPAGLLCYSEPTLLNDISSKIEHDKEENLFILFRFVKQHYKTSWIFLLFLNLFLYKRKIAILPFISSLFYRRRILKKDVLNSVEVQSTKKAVQKGTIDVIIPTIGRKKYLYDILKDLSAQTHLPTNVIVVEQNPNPESTSDLDYILSENWPFTIKHVFTHQAGACNARNLALSEVVSEWVFMADDDIRIDNLFLDKAFSFIQLQGAEQITFGCYGTKYPENKKLKQKGQSVSFGSGCSIVKTENIRFIMYNRSYEFGYGEDSDFGMQLRNAGFDILYSAKPEILHLQAPIGGFRTKQVFEWQNDTIQPKPSPTVMLYNLLHKTPQQIKGYKTTLFIKFYKVQAIKNPIKYWINFEKQWKQSLFWANELKNKK